MSNLTDIKGWPGNGLPIAGAWALKHDLNWWYANVLDWYRMLPTVKLPVFDLINVPKVTLELNAFADVLKFISDNELPLVLRHQGQLSMDMSAYHGTGPNETSASTWRINKLGQLDYGNVCDYFGPATLWATHGSLLASSMYMKRLQELCPNPGRIILLDNNEAFYPSPKIYSSPKPNNFRAWLSKDQLKTLSLRMVDYVDSIGSSTNAYEAWPHLQGLRKAQYDALYGAFQDGWNEWSGTEFLTGAYSAAADKGVSPPQSVIDKIGYSFEGVCYNYMGPASYLNGPVDSSVFAPGHVSDIDLNVPAWNWLEAKDPDNGRMVFLSVENKAALIPAQKGIHEVTSPDIFRAFCEWQAWLSKSLLLEHWIGNANGPNDLFFADKDPETTKELQDQLIALGRADLLGVTHGEYTLAPALAANSICEEAKAEFWLKGERITAIVNDSRVRVVAFKLDKKRLVFCMTPCLIDTPVVVTTDMGDLTVNFKERSSVYVIGQPSSFQWSELE